MTEEEIKKKNLKRYKIILWIFSIAGIILAICNAQFNISWLVNGVQDIINVKGDKLRTDLIEYKPFFYHLFFIVDSAFFTTTLPVLIYTTATALINVDSFNAFEPDFKLHWQKKDGEGKSIRWILIHYWEWYAAFLFST